MQLTKNHQMLKPTLKPKVYTPRIFFINFKFSAFLRKTSQNEEHWEQEFKNNRLQIKLTHIIFNLTMY